MKFWIYCWNLNYHGGVKALHRLHWLLIRSGYDCTMINPIEEQEPIRYIEPDDVMIYPENVNDPLGVGNRVRIVRWLLALPGENARVSPFPPSDKQYAFDPYMFHLTEGRRLFVNILHGAEDRGLPRTTSATWKGKGRRDYDIAVRGKEITSEWPALRSDLIAFLNSVDVLYTNDPHSGLVVEASICGCRIMWVERNGTTREWKFVHEDYDQLEADTFKQFLQDMENWK